MNALAEDTAFTENVAHLTWRGRVSWAYYKLRRLFVTPAPNDGRCFMGSVVDPAVWCPRRAVDGSLWCAYHQTEDTQ